MNPRAVILLVGYEEEPLADLRAKLEKRDGIRLLIVSNANEGIAVLRRQTTDLILGTCSGGTPDFLEFCGNVRSFPEFREIRIVMILDSTDAQTKADALRLGVREFLTRPVEPEELLSKVRGIVNLKRVRDEMNAMRTELDTLRQTDRRRSDRLIDALVSLIDMRFPGAARRSARITEISNSLAARFRVPGQYLRGLDVAARLSEIGHLALPPGSPDWQYFLSSKAILREIDGFEEAAELIGDVCENWDGSGLPGHIVCGQIPLRSRILRVVIDFVRANEGPRARGCDEALQEIARHSGTHYDPMVIVHLGTVVEIVNKHGGCEEGLAVQITELEDGMILLEDLVTGSGIKLLSRGTILNETSLRTILNRHSSDPVLRGAVVRRSLAA